MKENISNSILFNCTTLQQYYITTLLQCDILKSYHYKKIQTHFNI